MKVGRRRAGQGVAVGEVAAGHPGGLRAEMARALTLDTLDVLTAHPDIAQVVVVTADAEAAREASARGATVLQEQARTRCR